MEVLYLALVFFLYAGSELVAKNLHIICQIHFSRCWATMMHKIKVIAFKKLTF